MMKWRFTGAGDERTPATMVRSKWAAMQASIWIQCVSGTGYCFGIYSSVLKSTQQYDQQTLGTVAFFKDIGANAGVIAGALYSSSPDAGRSRLVLAAGAAQCFAGYFLMWLSTAGVLHRPPVSLMCIFMFLAAHSVTFFNTADVVTSARNFSHNRGTAIGIMKGYLGLSGAILIQIHQTLNNGDPSYFLLVLSLLPTTSALLLMYFVQVYPMNHGNDGPLLNVFSLIALITAGYLTIVIILENILTFGSSVRVPSLFVLLTFLASPVIITLKGHFKDSTFMPENTTSDQSLLPASSSEATEVGLGLEINLLQAIQTYEFWLLFIAMACGLGSGLATVNNISQIGSSLGYSTTKTDTLVSLWSIWNFTGRFGAGYISDYFMRSHGYARPYFMLITLAGMSVGHGLIATGLSGALYVGYVAIGVCYGSLWSLMPTIASEIFGFGHLGTIFNAIAVASPCGSYVLSVRVVGYIYDIESYERKCSGNHCFMLSFVIMAGVCLVGFGFSLALFFRTRKFYDQVLYPRFRVLDES